MSLLLAFYGSMAGLALWATWHESDLRWIGAAICFNFLASNAVWLFGPIASRSGVYTMCEILVALAAYMAWEDLRYRALPLLGMIAAISICANIVFAMQNEPIWTQIHTHEVITNICFTLECVVTFGMGVWHGARAGRFDRWSGHRHASGQSHGLGNREP